jgi:HAE1 family hydrophobic/amphiphilic exporter-1
MWLTRLSVQRPIFIITLLAALMLFGWYGYRHMPAELNPRVEIPLVNISAVYPGASPAQVEDRVTRPLEDALSTLPHVDSLESTSLENVATIAVRLLEGTDANAAAAEVRTRVEAARRNLPSEVGAPVIARVDADAQPAMVLGVNFARPQPGKSYDEVLRGLTEEAEKRVEPQLSRVQGVANVRVVGGWQQEVLIRVDPDRLQENDLSLPDLLAPLRAASLTAAAGSLRNDDRQEPVRVVGEFSSLDEMSQVPVFAGQAAGGAPALGGLPGAAGATRPGVPAPPLRLADVATEEFRARERGQIVHVGRRPGIIVEVTRLGGAPTVGVVDRLRERVRDLERRTPPGQEPLRIEVLQDDSAGVRVALSDIHSAILLGCLFAILMVYVFLHSLRDTLIIALQLPASIMATFGVMWVAGFTLNQMSMLGLALAIGILVDDSILVLDSIHRHRQMGKSPREAALDGRQEIGFADATNSFLDVVIYVPVALMAGIVGMYFRQFGLTVATASMLSLFVSFSFTPMLASRWFRREPEAARQTGQFGRRFDRLFGGLQELYRRQLVWALSHRSLVVTAGFGSLAVALLLAATQLRQEFVPPTDRGEINVSMETAPGLSLQATEKVMSRIEDLVAGSDVRSQIVTGRMFARVGEIRGGADRFPQRGPIYAELVLALRDRGGFLERLLRPLTHKPLRTMTDEQVALRLRQLLEREPPAEARRLAASAVRSSTGRRSPLVLTLMGGEESTAQLGRAAEQVRDVFSRLPGPGGQPLLYNVDTTQRSGLPELRVEVNRERAAELQVTPAEVVKVTQLALEGNTDLVFRSGSQDYPIRVAMDPAALRDRADLGRLIVTHRGGSPVYLDEVATLREAQGPTRLLRRDRQPMVRVLAELAPGVDLGTATHSARQAVESLRAQPSSALHQMRREDIQWGGDVESMLSSFQDIAWALVFAVALAYLLMAVLFNSFLHPLTIMFTLPMALVGAVLALMITRTPLSIVAMIGMVLLLGLVAKNAILLVDYTNTLRSRDGYDRDAAVIAAGPVRLRPILMTSLSTILSALPVALSAGTAAEIRAPMAIVTVGGLAFASLLTLIVIPVVYTYADDLSSRLHAIWAAVAGPWPERAARRQGYLVVPDGRPLAESARDDGARGRAVPGGRREDAGTARVGLPSGRGIDDRALGDAEIGDEDEVEVETRR